MKYCADTYSVEKFTARSQCLVCLNPCLLLVKLCKTVQFTVSGRAHIGNYIYVYLHESLHTGP